MSVHNEGAAFTKGILGTAVYKGATALVQNAANNLFTVSGGLVAVTALVGIVTTAVGANAITVQYRHTPSGGSAAALTAATTVTSDAAGTFWTLSTGIAADLISEQSPAGSEVPNVTFGPMLQQPIAIGTGTVDILSSNADPDGGAARYILTYVPLDDGARVVAA